MRALVWTVPLRFPIRLRLGPSLGGSSHVAVPLRPPLGTHFPMAARVERGKKTALLRHPVPAAGGRGLTSREDPTVEVPGLGPPMSPGGRAPTSVLVPDAGRSSTTRPGTRHKVPAALGDRAPAEDRSGDHTDSVPYKSRWSSRATLLVPNAGAGFSAPALDSGLLSLDCSLLVPDAGAPHDATPALAAPDDRIKPLA